MASHALSSWRATKLLPSPTRQSNLVSSCNTSLCITVPPRIDRQPCKDSTEMRKPCNHFEGWSKGARNTVDALVCLSVLLLHFRLKDIYWWTFNSFLNWRRCCDHVDTRKWWRRFWRLRRPIFVCPLFTCDLGSPFESFLTWPIIGLGATVLSTSPPQVLIVRFPSPHSPLTFLFAGCYFSVFDTWKAQSLIDQTPEHKRKLTGESLPMEVFITTRSS
jgi:hypothetical protein